MLSEPSRDCSFKGIYLDTVALELWHFVGFSSWITRTLTELKPGHTEESLGCVKMRLLGSTHRRSNLVSLGRSWKSVVLMLLPTGSLPKSRSLPLTESLPLTGSLPLTRSLSLTGWLPLTGSLSQTGSLLQTTSLLQTRALPHIRSLLQTSSLS